MLYALLVILALTYVWMHMILFIPSNVLMYIIACVWVTIISYKLFMDSTMLMTFAMDSLS